MTATEKAKRNISEFEKKRWELRKQDSGKSHQQRSINMKHFPSWLTIGCVLMLAVTVQAKAAYESKAQMIETAAAIAVVKITG